MRKAPTGCLAAAGAGLLPSVLLGGGGWWYIDWTNCHPICQLLKSLTIRILVKRNMKAEAYGPATCTYHSIGSISGGAHA